MKMLVLASIFFLSYQASANGPYLEKIMGYQPGNNSLSFQVRSGGCTQKSDFEIQVVPRDNRASEVYLYRIHKDPCLSFLPTGTHIKFSLDEIGLAHGQSFVIKNANGVVYSWIWPEDESEESKK